MRPLPMMGMMCAAAIARSPNVCDAEHRQSPASAGPSFAIVASGDGFTIAPAERRLSLSLVTIPVGSAVRIDDQLLKAARHDAR